MVIKRIDIRDFKGCRNASFVFGKDSTIFGQNGVGKTTIASAYTWVMSDMDYELHNNPPVFPNDGRECKPTVEIAFDINGVEVVVSRTQTRTIKESATTGNTVTSYSNTYTVNSVEYGLRDFQSKMSEYGVDMDTFMKFSHPDVFLSQANDKKSRAIMRDMLFQMADTRTDKEIASMYGDCADVATMLDSYSIDEITAMQKSTMRKINEEYGKNGEIIDAEIRGIESTRVDVDVDNLTARKNALQSDIESTERQIATQSNNAEVMALEKAIHNRGFAITDRISRATDALNDRRRKCDEDISAWRMELAELNAQDETAKRKLQDANDEIARLNAEIERLKPEYAKLKASTFDESSTVCKFCGQKLPDADIESLKEKFEHERTERIKQIADNGNAMAIRVRELQNQLANAKGDDLSEKISSLTTMIEARNADKASIPLEPDMTIDAEYERLTSEQRADMNHLDELKGSIPNTGVMESKLSALKADLDAVQNQLAQANLNSNIATRVGELEHKKLVAAQSKADCEKILYQLSLFEQHKNELLEESVNKHFRIVKWKLWGRQKNGEIVTDVCVPTIDGKGYGDSMNTGLKVLAQLDVLNGLQTFFGQKYPIFLDNAECLSANTEKLIVLDTQLIKLKVSEDAAVRVV